jgi:hypothetical protein
MSSQNITMRSVLSLSERGEEIRMQAVQECNLAIAAAGRYEFDQAQAHAERARALAGQLGQHMVIG